MRSRSLDNVDPPVLVPKLRPEQYTDRELLAEYHKALVQLDAIDMSENFASFVKTAWPVLEGARELDWNWHLDLLCETLEGFYRREFRYLIICVPPRTMKSTLISVMYPAWVWTKEPNHQFLALSHSADLATRDSVKARHVVESPWFRQRWPSVTLRDDQNEKRQYNTTEGGHRNSQGITSGITGKGGDSILIDDPHDAEKAQSDAERTNVLDAFDHKVVTRLNEPAKSGICITMQRLHERDLVGHFLATAGEIPEDEIKVVVLPMEYEHDHPQLCEEDIRTEPKTLLWESRYPEHTVRVLKKRLGAYGAAGQLQQRPTPAGGGILKKIWWRKWPESKPWPLCKHVLVSVDGAFSERDLKNNSHSAATVWGIFRHDEGHHALILLDAWEAAAPYYELMNKIIELTREHKPDKVLIERKASGQSLIQSLRRRNFPVSSWSPGKYMDKVVRAHSISPFLEQGVFYYPDRKWAEAVLDECNSFPNAEHDDITDTVTQAGIYFANSWWLEDSETGDYQLRDRTPRRGYQRPKRAAYG